MRIWLLGLILSILSPYAMAQKTGYRLAHPIGWMHQLPVGEQPGWSKKIWTNLEINHANIWNNDFQMTDRRSGNVYKYKADFEQSTLLLEVGGEILPDVSLSLEVPYAYRNGGILDDFIDQFHQFIGSNRFLRHLNDKFANSYQIQENGRDLLTTEHGEGVSALKPKLKWWIWKKSSTTAGACDCGLSVGAQVKFPTLARKTGMSNGSNDYTGMLNLGLPINSASGVWFSTALTKLGKNGTFTNWPMRKWHQMYELAFDFGITDGLGFVMQGRLESPLFDKEHLTYNYTASSNDGRDAERIASGWNSLVHWRGSQGIGPRWRWPGGSEANFLLIEDWAMGHHDKKGEWLYGNNAPDVAFVTQINIVY